jgi:hypothetical protein
MKAPTENDGGQSTSQIGNIQEKMLYVKDSFAL